ncbi:DoxX-like protein [Algoriphagus ratkowskyi]|uniref:DoxX family membrane protein n=1 Tax=Algoriphagus ratkowskyi TaxID=57028 RepID=A0A2W7RLH6_9BACT|nr:MauE/DoxX family redox-associated membrane protein [Algoriphagus ratkowskyi]PZX59350.1 DoxX-like protein [Algoriphagus ratkowskyi]TXD77384.1 DoxX family membrane protein [Algoriphagus ratkowskyi]
MEAPAKQLHDKSNDQSALAIQLSSLLLILLFVYTGLDKLIRWEESKNAFYNQTFPAELAEILVYAVPISELLIALLLLFSNTRWWGYLSSLLLLTVFTTYVGLIWVGAFPRVPCNCAGIIDQLGWGAHFSLNLILIGLAIVGLHQYQRKKPRAYAPGFSGC